MFDLPPFSTIYGYVYNVCVCVYLMHDKPNDEQTVANNEYFVTEDDVSNFTLLILFPFS